MPTTPGGIRYPAGSDTINIPQDFENLADDVESFIATNAVTATGTYTLTNKTIVSPIISDPTFTGQASGLELAVGQALVFEGATEDAFELTLSAGDPTADRTVTFQDATGTVALTSQVDNLQNDLEVASFMGAF
jgi:hypothetical protein